MMLEPEKNEMKVLAKEVFDGLRFGKIDIKNKDIKFYNVEGEKMALLAINYDCDIEGKKCLGCESCSGDKQTFANEYNLLSLNFKKDLISMFSEIEREVEEKFNKI